MVLIDVSTLLSIRRFTGIQRVILDALSSESASLVFRGKDGSWRGADNLKETSNEDKIFSPLPLSISLLIFEKLPLALGHKLSLRSPAYSKLHALVKTAMRAIHSRFRQQTARILVADGAENFEFSPGDRLILLDVPRDRNHIKKLEDEVLRRCFRLTVFVYDLIPVMQGDFVGEPSPKDVQSWYVEYLNLVSMAERVVFLSESSKNQYVSYANKKGWSTENVGGVVYPPVSLGSPDSTSRESGAEILPSARIFSIASLNRRKNLRVVLNAIPQLFRDHRTASFLAVCPAVTDVDLETVLKCIRLKLQFGDRFKLYESVDENTLRSLYEDSTVVVVPSLLEGFGLPAVEGLAYGCNVVASDSSSLTELGKNLDIQIVNPHSSIDWGKAIRKAISSHRPGQIPESFRKSGSEFLAQVVGEMH